MAMFVSRLPVGMPRSELEIIHKAAVRSARGERERERLDDEEEGGCCLKY